MSAEASVESDDSDDATLPTMMVVPKIDESTNVEKQTWMIPKKAEKEESTASQREQNQLTLNWNIVDDVDAAEDEEIDLDKVPEIFNERVVILQYMTKKQKIYLIGTNHFNRQSHRDVRQIIQAVEPNVVMLELCRSRMVYLHMSENEILDKLKSWLNCFAFILQNCLENGLIQGFINTLVWIIHVKKCKSLNIAPGGEFRNAYSEAVYIPGCSILLGDRPVDITDRRAFCALSIWQMIKFTWKLLFDNEKFIKTDIHFYTNEFLTEFPELEKVMVEERDQYLAHSLYSACESAEQGADIVGVVGIAHLAGIKAHWETADQINVTELLKIPEPSKIMFVLKHSFYVLVGYGLYLYLVPQTIKIFIYDVAVQLVAKVSRLI